MKTDPAATIDTPTPVAIRRLRLTSFRNYSGLELPIDGDIVALTGPNGAGKTNLIEAISLLSPGKGLRGAALSDLTHRSDTSGDAGAAWAVLADIQTGANSVTIATGLDPNARNGDSKRVMRIDGETVRSHRSLTDQINVVWLTPDMDQLLRGGASGRRKFIDRLVFGFDQDHAARVNAYTKAIAERARILKHPAAGAADDPIWLTAVEARAAEFGVAIAATRREVVAALNETLNAWPDDALPRAQITAAGTVEEWLEDGSALAAEDKFKAALASSRTDDRLAGRTQYGPHRSDLLVTHVGQNCLAARCSTGEQKAILVSLVLGYAEALTAAASQTPLVLLDEAVAHLDSDRRKALFRRLAQLPVQFWLTGTDQSQFDALPDLTATAPGSRNPVFLGVSGGEIVPLP